MDEGAANESRDRDARRFADEQIVKKLDRILALLETIEQRTRQTVGVPSVWIEPKGGVGVLTTSAPDGQTTWIKTSCD